MIKKIFRFFLSIFLVLGLLSCNYINGTKDTTTKEVIQSTTTTSTPLTTNTTTSEPTTTTNPVVTTTTVPTTTASSPTTTRTSTPTTTFTTSSPTTTSTTTITTQIDFDYTYNSSSISKSSFSYSTGNYFTYTINKSRVQVYRGVRSDKNNLVELLKKPDYTNYSPVESLNSAFYNQDATNDINYIAINYKSANDAIIYYSKDLSFENSYVIPANSSYKELVFGLDGANYYRLEAFESDLLIKTIKFDYAETKTPISNDFSYDGIRINPQSYNNSSLVSGVTKRSIPTKIEYDGSNYVVTETKEYTYYDREEGLEYITTHGKDDNYYKMVLTDPVDVANYYLLFEDFPINYMDKSDANFYYYDFEFFAPDIRCVSQYSRTNGYVTAIPLNMNNGSIVYYELDLKLDESYSPSSRGVGRLVVFTNGFVGEGYDTSPVIVYTDDHYATFNEFNNYGSFIKRFNAERNPTPYDWCNITTINL